MDVVFCGSQGQVLHALAEKCLTSGDRVSFYFFGFGKSLDLVDAFDSGKLYADVFVFDFLAYEWVYNEFLTVFDKNVPILFYNDPFADISLVSRWFKKNKLCKINKKMEDFFYRLSAAIESPSIFPLVEKFQRPLSVFEDAEKTSDELNLPPALRTLLGIFINAGKKPVSLEEISKTLELKINGRSRSVYSYISRLKKAIKPSKMDLVRIGKGKYKLISVL